MRHGFKLVEYHIAMQVGLLLQRIQHLQHEGLSQGLQDGAAVQLEQVAHGLVQLGQGVDAHKVIRLRAGVFVLGQELEGRTDAGGEGLAEELGVDGLGLLLAVEADEDGGGGDELVAVLVLDGHGDVDVGERVEAGEHGVEAGDLLRVDGQGEAALADAREVEDCGDGLGEVLLFEGCAERLEAGADVDGVPDARDGGAQSLLLGVEGSDLGADPQRDLCALREGFVQRDGLPLQRPHLARGSLEETAHGLSLIHI